MRAFQNPAKEKKSDKRAGMEKALDYMGLLPHTPITDIKPDKIFIGSCTNARIEDLRAAAEVLRGKTISSSIRQALVVPGSGLVAHKPKKRSTGCFFERRF